MARYNNDRYGNTLDLDQENVWWRKMPWELRWVRVMAEWPDAIRLTFGAMVSVCLVFSLVVRTYVGSRSEMAHG